MNVHIELKEDLIISVGCSSNTEFEFINKLDYKDNLMNDIQILEQDKKSIMYKFINKNKIFSDPHDHVIYFDDYFSFVGSAGIIMPINEDYSKKIKISVTHNIPITHKFEMSFDPTTIYGLANTLFVCTPRKYSYVSNKFTLMIMPNSKLFLTKKELISNITKYITIFNKFHKVKLEHIVINYKDFVFKNMYNTYMGNRYNDAIDLTIIQVNNKIHLTKPSKKKSRNYKKEYLYLLSHEIYHNYGIMVALKNNRGNIFTEGFTEFFCHFLIMEYTEFKKIVKLFYNSYMKNPYRNSPLYYMTQERFYKDGQMQILPYLKGFVYAYYLYKNDDNFFSKYLSLCNTVIYDLDEISNILKDPNFEKYIINGYTIPLILN